MDKTLEIVLCIVAALALIGILVWVTRLKIRGFARHLINCIAGCILIIGLSAFGVIELPFNLFNALIVGFLGVPGAAVVAVAAILL